MSRKRKHLQWSRQLAPVDASIGYCGKAVPHGDAVESRNDVGLVTCKRCLAELERYEQWHKFLKADYERREAAGEPEARRRAWLATEAEFGRHPRGFPVPKRSVSIHYYRGEDGRGRFEVAAPKGARFASGPHGRTYESRQEAERVRDEVELERCPVDCGCGHGVPVGTKIEQGSTT
jgi:hypothetical protein